ncbi:MAG: hypothetical protein EA422_00545 [Gemmatimonadales bacterium]|nr:MAG: hypothetical protein EA422_00545 [Gemmatimonadales bacterium]
MASGPNQTFAFVTGVQIDVLMRGIMNPAYSPGGVTRPATGGDAVACGASNPDTVHVNFHDYNSGCRGVNPAPFMTAAGAHEATHMDNVITYIAQYRHPAFDVPAKLERAVGATGPDLETRVNAFLENVPQCIHKAAATHQHLGGMLQSFPGIPTDIWIWRDDQATAFQLEPQGSAWWMTEPDPWNPFISPCSAVPS